MQTLENHLQTKDEERNHQWDETFFKLFSDSRLRLLSEDPQQGPDGWPYLLAETSKDTESENTDTAQKVLHWLSTRGIGLVVNPMRSPYPDFVFSYGMIWSFRETGYFIKRQEAADQNKLILDQNTPVTAGPPSKAYLPDYARAILRDFLRDQGVFAPSVLVVSTDSKNYDLCFSLESFGTPPESEHQGILEALSWFLPPHYSLALISENGLPPFEKL